MNEDDDDLPVLTQILRTGNAEFAAPLVLRSADALDPRTVAGTPSLADQLVIGHEPPRESDDYLAPSFHVSPPFSSGDEPDADHAPHPADSFVLSQDHDAPQVPGLSFDEPAYSVEPPAVAAPQPHTTEFAAKVRDAVLDDLSARIETELDARIAQVIHREVETALAQLQSTLRSHLAEALKDVVGRAVDEEIARLAAERPTDSA